MEPPMDQDYLMNEYTAQPYGNFGPIQEEMIEPLLKTTTFLLNITQFGVNFMVLLLSVIVVPAQVEKLVKASQKGRALGCLVAAGAVLTFLASPLIGMLSDRITNSMGKRRPVMLAGTALLCVGLLGMALSAPEISLHGNPMANVGTLIFSHMSNVSYHDIYVPHRGGKEGHGIHCEVDLVSRRCQPFERENPHSVEPASYELGNVAAHAHGIVLPRYTNYKSGEQTQTGILGAYVPFFLLVVVSQTAVSIAVTSLLADLTHPIQRGFNSGVMGTMILLGNIAGAGAGIIFTRVGVHNMYTVIIGVEVICVLTSTFSVSENIEELGAKPITCRKILTGYFEPLKDSDFRWVFITRFFMQMGVATITGFLEYWLNDVIPLPYCWSAATAVSLLLLPLLFAAAMSSLVLGLLSDKTGYRKLIVAVAAFTMGIGSFINAFLSGHYAYFMAALMAFIIGLGFGAYLAVDFALVMDILTNDANVARDVAVWHQSLVLPQAVAAPLGGFILDLFEKVNCQFGLGYVILFVLSSVYFIISAVVVFKIKKSH